jgi:hypothetical protein
MFEFGDGERVTLSAGEPTRPEMTVAAIAIFPRDLKLEGLCYGRGFFLVNLKGFG